MKKKVSILIIILSINVCIAQTIVKYKMPDGQIFSEKVFDVFKKSFKKQGLEYIIIDSTMVNNTLTRIIDIKSEGYFAAKENKEEFDPFAKFKKSKGQKFEIDKFTDNNGIKFSKDELIGKPTIINFWFTSCAPCITEMPQLIKLKNKFKDKLNYLAITFDDKSKVDNFLKKKDFPFTHITNAREQINNIGISGYPMTYILDSDGKIYEVYGGISDFEYKEIDEKIKKIL